MSAPAGRIRPWRHLTFFLLIVTLLYTLVFFTGDHRAGPKLGIDLQGGTRVTLTARTETGAAPSREALDQARTIIESRVNSLGVGGAEVVVAGSQLVITVPGEGGDAAKSLGQTARLYFRPVIGQQVPSPQDGGGSSAACTTYREELDRYRADQSAVATPALIGKAKECRQNPALAGNDQAALQAAAATLDCSPDGKDPLVGNDDPGLPLVACDRHRPVAYLLGASFLDGAQISDASAQLDPQGAGYAVTVDFRGAGSRIWGDYTTAHVGGQAAFVLDTKVVSAPTIQEPIVGGSTRINGGAGGFGQGEAKDLATVLKYGSLPLSFEPSENETVSATLGLASLRAGLIAGGIGLALVFVYCLFYYRLLGLLTVLSLVLSGVIVFPILVLLGRWIGLTLDLAGVAGFIVAIGITADSFIIFFERLKDEIREGRTFRSAVPRAWPRARRTILSADAVSFLASAVLYLLTVGQVRGFAFTLGMSTVLDLLVVFLVTHPLIALAARTRTWSNPRYSGLGRVRKAEVDRRAEEELLT
jgi:preprotein translocase subunit SecD